MIQQEILMVSKEDKTYSEAEVIDFFNKSESLDEIKGIVEKAEDRIYTSWATVDAVDKDGQKVPIDEAIAQQEILMERGAPIRSTHQGKDVGKTLAYRVLQHPETGTTGILHLNKIYNHNILDDKSWNETKSGNGGSSVGGFATNKQMTSEEGSIFESLKGFNWLETTNTGKPRNVYTTGHAFSEIAKEDQQDKMVEENKTAEINKEDAEVSTETPEVSMEDRVGKLEEGLGAVMAKMDELIQATAGTPEVEKEESEPVAEEKEVEKEADNTEEDKKEEEDVNKSLDAIKSELSDVKKQLEANKVVEVVKSEMPEEVDKSEKKTLSFSKDVMSGKVSLKEFAGAQ